MERCCWKASGGEMEGEAFLEECIELKEGMAKMNLLESFTQHVHLFGQFWPIYTLS